MINRLCPEERRTDAFLPDDAPDRQWSWRASWLGEIHGEPVDEDDPDREARLSGLVRAYLGQFDGRDDYTREVVAAAYRRGLYGGVFRGSYRRRNPFEESTPGGDAER